MSWTDDRFNKILKWVGRREYEDFIDENEIEEFLSQTKNAGKDEVRAVIKKAKENAVKGTMLTPYEAAVLLNNSHDEIWDEILTPRRRSKRKFTAIEWCFSRLFTYQARALITANTADLPPKIPLQKRKF